MGQDPDVIRQQIEETRGRMSDTVDALGYKADVPARAKDKIGGMADAITGRAGELASRITGTAGDAASRVNDVTPSAEDVKATGRKAVGLAQENPLGLIIGAAAVGFLAGVLIPSTRIENEKLGEAADQVKGKLLETGQEVLEHGKQVAQDVAQSSMETAKESGQQHAQELVAATQEKGEQAVSGAQDSLQSNFGG